jgi:hypothetical protein
VAAGRDGGRSGRSFGLPPPAQWREASVLFGGVGGPGSVIASHQGGDVGVQHGVPPFDAAGGLPARSS